LIVCFVISRFIRRSIPVGPVDGNELLWPPRAEVRRHANSLSTTISESGRRALRLAKYSFGVSDRFAPQEMAQLRACILAAGDGIEVVPVWNKSFREHSIVSSKPRQVREATAAAVRGMNLDTHFGVNLW
jgi:hypothetical protein